MFHRWNIEISIGDRSPVLVFSFFSYMVKNDKNYNSGQLHNNVKKNTALFCGRKIQFSTFFTAYLTSNWKSNVKNATFKAYNDVMNSTRHTGVIFAQKQTTEGDSSNHDKKDLL